MDSCPVHIGLMFNEHFYELKIKGAQRYNAQKLFNWIKVKKIKACLISFNETDLKEEFILETFNSFSLEDKNTTCLDPVKKILTEGFGINFNNAETIFDVISLIKDNRIKSDYFYLGIEDFRSFKLNEYTRNQVFNYINVLR